MIIVIAVIAILFVVLITRAAFASDKAKETGVKNDFRSFSVAAEQVLSEHSGLSDISDEEELVEALNEYLDDALKFNSDGTCSQADPWNKLYTLQYAKPTETGSGNNGAIIFCSGGRDGVLNGTTTSNDDYVIAVVFEDGANYTATTGFASNIEGEGFVASDITPNLSGTIYTESTDTDDLKIQYYSDGSSVSGTRSNTDDSSIRDDGYFTWKGTMITGFSNSCPDEAKVNLVIPDTCTEIGEEAFYLHSEIKSISLPTSLTKINMWAFASTGISNITIPDSVQSLGYQAFASCDSLQNVTISGNIEDLDSYIFSDCLNLTNIILNDGIKQISEYMFYGCEKITNIKIPSSVTTIGGGAFFECTGLYNIEISEGLEEIGENAFCNCKALSSITLPNTVKSIETNAFQSCINLQNITLPSSVVNIGLYPFSHCDSLAIIYVDYSLKDYEANLTSRNNATVIWINDPSYTSEAYFNWNGTIITGFSDDCPDEAKVNVSIPPTCTEIASGAFANHTEIQAVTLPSTLTTIGHSAFNGCTSLSEIYVPGSIKQLNSSTGVSMFANCSNLKTVTLGEGITSVGYGAFNGCTSLTQVNLPSTLTELGVAAFQNDTSLQSIVLPDNVTDVWAAPFSGCSSLRTIIASSASKNCENGLKSGNSATVVYKSSEDYFTWNGTTLTGFSDSCPDEAKVDVVIPEKCTDISNWVFGNDCTKVQSLYIPGSVKTLGYRTFSGCTNLTKVTFGNGIEGFGYGALSGTSIEEIYLPDSVTLWNTMDVCNSSNLKTIYASSKLKDKEDIIKKGNNATIIWR